MGPQQVGVAISHASLSLAPHCLLRQLLPTPRLSSLLRSAQDEGHDDDNADLAFGHSHAHAHAHPAHSMTPIPFATGGGGNPHLTCGSGHLSSGSLGMDAGHSVGWVVQPSLDWPRAQVSRARGGGGGKAYLWYAPSALSTTKWHAETIPSPFQSQILIFHKGTCETGSSINCILIKAGGTTTFNIIQYHITFDSKLVFFKANN